MQSTFANDKPFNSLPLLPPIKEVETIRTLKKAISARVAISELRATGSKIPNQSILIRALTLQEAKLSSEIENIVTTNDKLYRELSEQSPNPDPQTKEVLGYQDALWMGYQHLQEGGFLNTNLFIEIVQTIRRVQSGIRTMHGTHIVSSKTSEIIYTPPIGEKQIRDMLFNLSEFLYQEDGIDPLIKMAIAHYQFEAIHPFTDGNGRTGRVINILYLIHSGLLDLPTLYLSKYIIQNKSRYYECLRAVTESGDWEDWILYLLDAVEVMALETRDRMARIHEAMLHAIEITRAQKPKIYRRELIELIFEQPYTRISSIEKAGIVKRDAAAAYLRELEEIGVLKQLKQGRELLFLNTRLMDILVK